MDKYFQVSSMLFFIEATLSSFKKKKDDFIIKHLTDFAM